MSWKTCLFRRGGYPPARYHNGSAFGYRTQQLFTGGRMDLLANIPPLQVSSKAMAGTQNIASASRLHICANSRYIYSLSRRKPCTSGRAARAGKNTQGRFTNRPHMWAIRDLEPIFAPILCFSFTLNLRKSAYRVALRRLCGGSSSVYSKQKRIWNTCVLHILFWWAIRDLNPGPTGYEPVALTN